MINLMSHIQVFSLSKYRYTHTKADKAILINVCFHRPVSCDSGSVGRAKKKKKKKKNGKKNKWTLEGVWIPEKAGLLSKKAWLESQLENVVFSFVIRSVDVNLRQGYHIMWVGTGGREPGRKVGGRGTGDGRGKGGRREF